MHGGPSFLVDRQVVGKNSIDIIMKTTCPGSLKTGAMHSQESKGMQFTVPLSKGVAKKKQRLYGTCNTINFSGLIIDIHCQAYENKNEN